jgi:predicted alpha/beta superfamily hydrolase
MNRHLVLSFLFLAVISANAFSQVPRDRRSHHTIRSESLSEDRLVVISVPPNYQKSGKRYPVIYVLDSEWVFDFADASVNYLSNFAGRIPQMIVVGIPNTDRNRDLFVTLDPKDGYSKFIEFLESELIPFVNKNYRTNGFDTIYGFSSGSGICSQMLSTKPHLFDAFIESGSGIGPKTSKFLEEMIPSKNFNNHYLYVSTEGNGPRVPGLRRYEELIKKLNPNGLKWKFDVLENSNHADVLSEGLYRGLKFIFADFAIFDSVAKQGADEIISYFRRIDKKFNFDVEIPAATIIESTTVLFVAGKPREAEKLLLYGIKLHPESYDLFASLGEFYEGDDHKKAAMFYKLASEKALENPFLYKKFRHMFLTLSKKASEKK